MIMVRTCHLEGIIQLCQHHREESNMPRVLPKIQTNKMTNLKHPSILQHHPMDLKPTKLLNLVPRLQVSDQISLNKQPTMQNSYRKPFDQRRMASARASLVPSCNS